MALWAALSLLPDADVVGFALGVQYGDPWGHRGATHSLTFSAALGLAIGLAAPKFGRPATRTALMAGVVLASHALLDTMTDGGLGCALFWPFDLTRYFAPWRPIPVAPIGLALFSPHGGLVALTETALFSPALVFALRSRHMQVTRGVMSGFVVLWLVAVWLISSGDRLREEIMGFVVATALDRDACQKRGIETGMSLIDAERLLGSPPEGCWRYSWSPGNRHHRMRMVCFLNARVETVLRQRH